MSSSSDPAAPLLDVEHLRVSVPVDGRSRDVVHDATFAVRPGEALALVGESGAGKSMTMHAIARVQPRSQTVSGRVAFEGADVLALRGPALTAYRRRVGVAFQDTAAHFNPLRRVGDFMTEALRVVSGLTRREAEAKALRALHDVGVRDGRRRMDQWPHELSGGVLQRVLIAAVLVTEPTLILADEPTSALDVSTQSEVIGVLDRLRRDRGLAMVLVTHDLDLAAATCDRIAVMYAGRVVESLPGGDLHRRARHPYTALLAEARPRVDRRAARLNAIAGTPVNGLSAPSSCAFAPRCPVAAAVCESPLPLVPRADVMDLCVRSDEILARDLLRQVRA
jgi:oligopeptide/dipeptide ABC transporter ATP-binding protein